MSAMMTPRGRAAEEAGTENRLEMANEKEGEFRVETKASNALVQHARRSLGPSLRPSGRSLRLRRFDAYILCPSIALVPWSHPVSIVSIPASCICPSHQSLRPSLCPSRWPLRFYRVFQVSCMIKNRNISAPRAARSFPKAST